MRRRVEAVRSAAAYAADPVAGSVAVVLEVPHLDAREERDAEVLGHRQVIRGQRVLRADVADHAAITAVRACRALHAVSRHAVLRVDIDVHRLSGRACESGELVEGRRLREGSAGAIRVGTEHATSVVEILGEATDALRDGLDLCAKRRWPRGEEHLAVRHD